MVRQSQSNLTNPSPVQKALEGMIREHSRILEIPAKEIFLSPSENIDGLYYVAEGRTRHYMMAEDGTEKVLYTLTAGWFFGDAAYILGQDTSLYSQAEIATRIWHLPRAWCDRLVDTEKLFRDAILQSFAKKQLILRHEVEDLVFGSCKERLKRLLCSAADTDHKTDDGWYDLKIHYTQYELSAIVGSARVTVNKLINELCAEGFARMLNRKMQLRARAYEQFICGM
ncbi:Crp/Fnr family transcriptional regulator [Lawsonibacter hominis]|uniref:Crp/Fnr family transcriptional regulator n=1 Tax=Lawsonibacter hominis TaxID=2763053 RepID=UPI00331FB32E